jgi:hypothetical protein
MQTKAAAYENHGLNPLLKGSGVAKYRRSHNNRWFGCKDRFGTLDHTQKELGLREFEASWLQSFLGDGLHELKLSKVQSYEVTWLINIINYIKLLWFLFS